MDAHHLCPGAALAAAVTDALAVFWIARASQRAHPIDVDWGKVGAIATGVAGLAVGAVPELCVRPGMKILTEKDGFPALGSFEIGLVRKPGRASSAIEALARHVTESLSNITTAMIAAE